MTEIAVKLDAFACKFIGRQLLSQPMENIFGIAVKLRLNKHSSLVQNFHGSCS